MFEPAPTWLSEKVTLYHFTHAAQLLPHELRVRNTLNELGQEDARGKRTRVMVKQWKMLPYEKHLRVINYDWHRIRFKLIGIQCIVRLEF